MRKFKFNEDKSRERYIYKNNSLITVGYSIFSWKTFLNVYYMFCLGKTNQKT